MPQGKEAGRGPLLSLAGLIAVYLVVFAATVCLKKSHVLPWPFLRVPDLYQAYAAIGRYLPFLLFPALALFWMLAAGIPVRRAFAWNRTPPVFYVALLCSIGYTLYLLVLRDPALRGGFFWPPVVILSIMNAVSEEFAFRQAFFQVFQTAGYPASVSNVGQGLFYALAHFAIGGAVFGALAFFYGLLLGLVRIRSGGISAGIICHFWIDIGCIGYPMLVLPKGFFG